MRTTREQYNQGKWDILTKPPYPKRIGHVTGAKDCYLAEHGRESLGYHKSLNQAVKAITDRVEKGY